jgi:D-aminopeptidase
MLEAGIEVVEADGEPYGALSGFLGQGRMELLGPVGGDVWALPGDWTLAPPRRDAAGSVTGAIMMGCWLARGLSDGRIG